MEIQFDVSRSEAFNAFEKETIQKRIGSRINEEGILKLTESGSRSQLDNKEAAVKKLFHLLSKALITPKARKATKPSKASKLKKLETKKKQSEKKQWRKKLF